MAAGEEQNAGCPRRCVISPSHSLTHSLKRKLSTFFDVLQQTLKCCSAAVARSGEAAPYWTATLKVFVHVVRRSCGETDPGKKTKHFLRLKIKSYSVNQVLRCCGSNKVESCNKYSLKSGIIGSRHCGVMEAFMFYYSCAIHFPLLCSQLVFHPSTPPPPSAATRPPMRT